MATLRQLALSLERHVEFLETPREEAYATVAVSGDLHGNTWDLMEPRR
ncbi:hypothetical protein [Cystobacter fuscus]